MKWQGRRKSDNLEDRRGMSGGGKAVVGGGALVIIIFLLNTFGGENGQMIGNILEQTQGQQTEQTESRDLTAKELEEQKFVNAVLVDNEDVWTKIFNENNLNYKKPTIVLFSDGVQTACGNATSDSGPFYCPGDQKVYMD